MSGGPNRDTHDLAVISAAIAVYIAITALLAAQVLTPWDLALKNLLQENGGTWVSVTGGILAHAGQGGPLSGLALAIAAFQVYRTHSLRPAYLWLATFILLLLLVLPAKIYFRRGAPGDPLASAVELFSKDFCGTPACESYPGGHSANSIVWYGLAMLLMKEFLAISIRRVIQVSAAMITALATIAAGYHWATDDISGIMVGLVIYRLVRRLDTSDMGYIAYFDKRLLKSNNRKLL